ncbi:MAG: helix-turn-helix domain-containing protein [Saccharofermentanales bacterium]
MNYIGEKIKELRRKNDMTQEMLADYLSVSYQSVSKWETGITSPDLSLIVPLSRLFKVSTDELFGVDGENGRRAEFNAAYENYWQKDKDEMHRIATQAVAEFPGDYKYLGWLASMEYYIAFDEDYRNGGSLDYFHSMLEKSRKHYDMVISGCTDTTIREKALYGIILVLKFDGKLQEAKKYAGLFPEKQGYNRDMMLELCTEGEELLTTRQRIVYAKTNELLSALQNIWYCQSDKTLYVRAAVDISEALISNIVKDQNYLQFGWHLYQLYIERAEISIADNNHENAVKYLAMAKEYATKRDSYNLNGKGRYTCTVFDHVEVDLSCKLLSTDSMDYWKQCINKNIFNPIRERDDFKALYQN